MIATMETPVSLLDQIRQEPTDETWKRLVDLYTPFLESWLSVHGLQPADRADLVQEVLKTMVSELPKFVHNGKKGAFRAWLRMTAKNRLLAFWAGRKRARTVAADLDQFATNYDSLDAFWDREHDRQIAQRLLDLMDKEFEKETIQAFRLRVEHGKSAPEVARQVGITVNAVNIAKSRVLARLRQVARGLIDA